MDRSRVAIVIPALNEERTIGDVVRGVSPFGHAVVVDDGSRDRTAEIAGAAGAHVVRHPENRGYDGALDTGFAAAARLGVDCIVTVDADGQHVPSLIEAFLREIEAGADVVVGVRDRRQRFGEHAFAWTGQLLWGLKDPLCGMKAYRTAVYRALGHFDAYRSIGTELALYAVRRGLKVAQVPIATRDRSGQPRFGRRWSANARILRALMLGLVRRS